MAFRETKIAAARNLRESLEKTFDYRDTDSVSRNKSLIAHNLVESLGEGIVTEWTAGLASNWMSKIDPTNYGFDAKYTVKNLRESLHKAKMSGALKEANTASTLGQLLTLGAEAIFLDRFSIVDCAYKAVTTPQASDADTQVYADTFRPGIGGIVAPGEAAPEVNLQSMGTTVKNYKYMNKLNFTEELVSDDQTGKIAKASAEAAKNVDYFYEAWWVANILYTPGTYGSVNIPGGGLSPNATTVSTPQVSTTFFQAYNDPDNVTGLYQSVAVNNSTRINRPATFGAPTIQTLRYLETLAAVIQQPDGQIVMSHPDTLWYHPYNRTDVETIINSPVWPGSVNSADTTAPGGATNGAWNAPNPMKGRYTLVSSNLLPYSNSLGYGAWGIMDKSAYAQILQTRDALQLLMEAPNAGASFEKDLVQWRVRRRATIFIFPGTARYFFLGANGSTAS